MNPAPSLVIFDLGGTTIRDRGEVPSAFAEALAAGGLGEDQATVTTWRGASKREVLAHLIATQRPTLGERDRNALAATVYQMFSTILQQRLRATPDLALPEARPVFERLQRAGIKVALNSGFDRAVLDVVLAMVRWPQGLLDTIVCSDDVPAGRPAPFMIFRAMKQAGVSDVGRVAVVGDTRLDLEAAANAGVAYRIGVLGGAHDRATLSQAAHTEILESVGLVPDLWLPDGATS